MATLREHLKKFHKTQADHQRSREADHSALEECFGKLASLSKAAKSEMKDGDGESLSEHLQKIAAAHGSLAQHAGSCAADHDAAMEECSVSRVKRPRPMTAMADPIMARGRYLPNF